MAMIKCKECDEEVSDSAARCPKCGYQINKPKRGIFGKIIKWSFILFNFIMLWWLIGGVGANIDTMEAMDGATKTGAAIGTGLGAMMIMFIWLVGDIILGLFVLFTRPKS